MLTRADTAHLNKAVARRLIEDVLNDGPLELVEGDKVVGRFACSGTHRGPWLGYAIDDAGGPPRPERDRARPRDSNL